MKKTFSQITLFLSCLPCFSHAVIHYEVSFPNFVHHEAQISMMVNMSSPGSLILRMSESSPGRYAIHEFAKNVYAVKANDENGASLNIVKTDIDTWEVKAASATVRITYTLFGNLTDGTYASINETHAHLNMPATFMWVEERDQEPISIHFNIPEGKNWKVATQLKPGTDLFSFTAPGLQYFMDSPTELSDFTMRTWNVTNTNGKTAIFRIALHHAGTEADADSLMARTKKLVIEEMAVYGELADYDYGMYTFIMDLMPGNDGDGMEHRNSTCITLPFGIKGFEASVTEIMAHEFFHSWNVERMRPRTLEPFDFTRANMSGELWFAEGFTQYYGNLLSKRSGKFSLLQWCGSVGGELNYTVTRPGTHSYSPVEMSQWAPFADAATSIDPTNSDNIFTSYYYYGSAVALALDLTLREQYKNITLDDFMKACWLAYGKTEIPYTISDLQKKLSEVTGDPKFAASFFQKYIYGHELNDYATLLSNAGFTWKKKNETSPWIGDEELVFKNGMMMINSPSIMGDPLYNAGLDKGDAIQSVDGKKIKNQKMFEAAINKHHAGDAVTITWVRTGSIQNSTIQLTSNPEMELLPIENTGKEISADQEIFRKSWLGQKVFIK